MKNLNFNQKELIAYASAFVSFVLPKIKNVKEIILFGSAARGDSEKESDVDIFINTEEKEAEETEETINKELNKFYKSKIAEVWEFKKIKNPLKIKVGNLEKWKLKRSIISDGIILYGKYKEIPENLNAFAYFNLNPLKNITKRNYVLRKLFGRKEKNYSTSGIVEKTGGKKLSALSFIVPLELSQEILNLLNSQKLDYTFFEFWSDKI